MPNDDLAEYFRTLTNERSIRALALRASLDPSTTTRQLSGRTSLTIETVVAICRAYGLDFAQVFVAVGFITEEEARTFNSALSLASFKDAELAREIVRRLEVGEASATLTEPVASEVIEEVLDERTPKNVVRGSFGVGGRAEDELDAVARPTDPEPTDEQ